MNVLTYFNIFITVVYLYFIYLNKGLQYYWGGGVNESVG